MDLTDPASVALLAATSLHAGFQLTVTLVVYPALARVPPQAWAEAHHAHTHGIAPLVVLVYGSLAGALTWFLVTQPGRLAGWLTAALVALAVADTGLLAAPTHRRLAAGRDPALVARLLRVDRLRAVTAALAVATAAWAALR